MGSIRKYILILLIGIFLVNQAIERVFHLHIYPLYSYLDDLLVVPIVLGIYQWLVQRSTQEKIHPFYFIPLTVLMLSVHFEWMLPLVSEKYTADILDVVMYIAGALLYTLFFYIKQETIKSLKHFL